MYKFLFITLTIIASVLFDQLKAQLNDTESNHSLDKLYQEMTPKDRLFITTSHIISYALLKKMDSISQESNQKEHYCNLINDYLMTGVQLLQKKGLNKKQATLITTSHLQFIANKFFSIKSMLMIQNNGYNFKAIEQHQKKRTIFFDALNCTLEEEITTQ